MPAKWSLTAVVLFLFSAVFIVARAASPSAPEATATGAREQQAGRSAIGGILAIGLCVESDHPARDARSHCYGCTWESGARP